MPSCQAPTKVLSTQRKLSQKHSLLPPSQNLYGSAAKDKVRRGLNGIVVGWRERRREGKPFASVDFFSTERQFPKVNFSQKQTRKNGRLNRPGFRRHLHALK